MDPLERQGGPGGGEGLTHLDRSGAARMVDVGGKEPTRREARASARVRMLPATQALIRSGSAAKGDVLQAARLAGIQAAKLTPQLIPLCHPLPLERVSVEFAFEGEDLVEVRAEAAATWRTGVEMEALTAAAVAALTVYDMLKSADRAMVIESIRLEEKRGGKSDFRRG
jgi:cyclic pyranopterin phosphate synthase